MSERERILDEQAMRQLAIDDVVDNERCIADELAWLRSVDPLGAHRRPRISTKYGARCKGPTIAEIQALAVAELRRLVRSDG